MLTKWERDLTIGMSEPAALRILYVEDDASSAEELSAVIANHGHVMHWEKNGLSGLRRAASEEFDVILLDRMLPDMDGISIVTRLREAGIETPVLMLSALGRSENRIEGLEAGVDDYLAKPYEPEEIVARIRALHRRSAHKITGSIIIYGNFECHVKARTAFRSNRHIALSPKEFELFKYLMENAGDAVTRDQLLRDVWKMDFDPQTNVVDVNIGRLRRKLEEGFSGPAIETIWGSGYRLTNGQ
ncbi:response regulator transcription factor [Sphingorhabdus arenilitoris]|uniref:Response regulator transcription factor n=1 Tax=Sphingorhabdus arenilitoris TaxID=1490041 RepID=A0ABV8RFE0_9SPHN